MTHSMFPWRLVRLVLIVTLVFTSSPWAMLPVHAASPIVIGEVAWAGSSLSTADEWLELWNLSSQDLPLAGYSLRDASDKPIFLPNDAVIVAHGTYLVSNYAADDPKSVIAAPVQVVTTTVSLSNSALRITLVDPNGVEVDVAGSGVTPPAGSSGSTLKTSMIRLNDGWISATTSAGFDPGRNDLGTPGVCDGCTIDEPTTDVTPQPPPPVLSTSSTVDAVENNASSSTSILIVPENTTSTDVAFTSSTKIVLPSETDASSTTTAIENLVVSSTEPLPIDLVTESSSTVTLSEVATTTVTTTATATTSSSAEIVETTSSTMSVQTTTSIQNASIAVSATSPATITPPQYGLIRLNELMPQPNGEAEWIEVTTLNPDITVPLAGVQIHDATGKIFTFATGTLDGTTPFMRIFLSSSRLNNDGDAVSLHDPNGNLLESFTYASSKKGETWARSPDGNGIWQLTSEATPNLPNVIPTPLPPPVEAPMTTTAPEPVTIQEATPITPLIEKTPPIVNPPSVKKVATPSIPKQTAVPKKTVSAPKQTATTSTQATKKIIAPTPSKTTPKITPKSTKAAAAAPKPITFDMTQSDSNAGIRVSLQGTVGSPSGLLTAHSFVLLAADGRGLLIHVPTSRKLPDMNTGVTVDGTLVFSDTGVPSLKLNAKDNWTVRAENSPAPSPHIVDLLAPSVEDGWSLADVTGTIVSIKGTNLILNMDDVNIGVVIKPIVGYRVARLAVGDTVRVRGLLDLTTESPRILPRTTDDITLVSHAVLKAAAGPMNTLPGWTPFGAAGLAIAGTEGFKQLRTRRKTQALERMLKEGSTT